MIRTPNYVYPSIISDINVINIIIHNNSVIINPNNIIDVNQNGNEIDNRDNTPYIIAYINIQKQIASNNVNPFYISSLVSSCSLIKSLSVTK